MDLAPPVAELTQFTREAQHVLRDPSLFEWTTIPLLGFAIYVYSVEIERRDFGVVLAGLAVWLMNWLYEVVNALVLHFTDHAAIWTATGETSFQITVGLNIEISLFFFVAGIIFVKQLPADPRMRILGIPNRAFLVLAFSCFSVFVEVLLHATGYFHWPYSWWNFPNVWLIVLIGYVPFYAIAAWIYDTKERSRQLKVVGTVALVDVTLIVVFGLILGWI